MSDNWWAEIQKVVRENCCAECGGELVAAMVPAEGRVMPLCGKDKSHKGFKEVPTYTQLWRWGQLGDPYITMNLERKFRRRYRMEEQKQTGMVERVSGEVAIRKPEVFFAVVHERYPDVPAKEIMLFCFHAIKLGLDPVMGEIYPTLRRVKDKQVLVPIISEQGALSLAARSGPQIWNGPPTTTLVTDPALKEAVSGDPNAWVWEAKGRRKDWEPGREYSTYGWMTTKQIQEAREKHTPQGELPGNQARVRAIKRWVLESYPEAASRIRAMANALAAEQESTEALDFIEAQYTLDIPAKQIAGSTPAIAQARAAPPALATSATPAEAQSATPPVSPGMCPIHNVPFIKGQYGPYHRLPDGSACKGKEKKAAPAAQKPLIQGEDIPF